MRSYSAIVALVVLTVGLLSHASAELIPTPDFSDHPIPTSRAPQARSAWWGAVDMAALVLALSLATYFAHVTRSRRHLFLLTIASLVWFGFVRGGCVCAIGATQNVALAICDSSYAVPLSVVVFFCLPLVFTLFFGRTFCAAVCPLGAIQELVAVRTVRIPSWLNHSLGLVPYFYLGAAAVLAGTGTAFIICRYDPFVAFFRLSGSAPMLAFGACLLFTGAFVGRPYCRFLCPYGAILRVLSRFSKWHVRIPPSDCVQCRLCEDVCPYDAIETPTGVPSAAERASGKRRLLVVLALAPILVAGMAWAGRQLSEPLAGYHPVVRLAEQLRKEELGLTQQTTKASDAFRLPGNSPTDAYRKAIDLHDHYRSRGVWLGAWVGLVVAGKLVQLSIRRSRAEFEPNHAGCVSCGRCYWYCPVEQVRCGTDLRRRAGCAGDRAVEDDADLPIDCLDCNCGCHLLVGRGRSVARQFRSSANQPAFE